MEMGRRDMRRGEGTNRFPKKKSGSVVSAKIKKGKLKKLSLADDDERMNRKKQEMMMLCYDFPASDLDNEDVSKQKMKKKKSSKLLKKNLKESNGVVHPHASVPRKLRSAMKKRNLESVSNLSSPSKRLNPSKTGVESLNMDYLVKKDNQETDAKDIVSESMMISKDEEEVAETLFGLADMFTEAGSVDNKTCDPLLSDDDKETSKADSIMVVETDVTTKDEPLEPAVSVLSSAKPKQLDEMPLHQDHNQPCSVTGMVGFVDRLKQNCSVNVTDAPARAVDTKAATSDIDYKNNGLALWPGLSSTVQSGSHVLSKPSSTKLPPWMGQAVSPTKNTSLGPRKLKKCASHIYICQLIKALQTSKSNQTEQRSLETSECRVPEPVTTISAFKSKVGPSIRYQNPHLIDLHKIHDPRPVEEDKTQLSLELYGPHTTQKQSYDFLSLSSNGAAQSHFPFPNSFPQYPISAAYNSQLSPTLSSHQMQQMSPYLASRFQTAYNANQQQQQQLQKRMWAAQYRPLTSGNTVPNQYSKPNLSLNLNSIQPLHVASSARYNNNVSQQQHRLMSAAAAMSMSHHHNNYRSQMVMNRQEHHFPFIYDDTRTPLQLLCNEQS